MLHFNMKKSLKPTYYQLFNLKWLQEASLWSSWKLQKESMNNLGQCWFIWCWKCWKWPWFTKRTSSVWGCTVKICGFLEFPDAGDPQGLMDCLLSAVLEYIGTWPTWTALRKHLKQVTAHKLWAARSQALLSPPPRTLIWDCFRIIVQHLRCVRTIKYFWSVYQISWNVWTHWFRMTRLTEFLKDQ